MDVTEVPIRFWCDATAKKCYWKIQSTVATASSRQYCWWWCWCCFCWCWSYTISRQSCEYHIWRIICNFIKRFLCLPSHIFPVKPVFSPMNFVVKSQPHTPIHGSAREAIDTQSDEAREIHWTINIIKLRQYRKCGELMSYVFCLKCSSSASVAPTPNRKRWQTAFQHTCTTCTVEWFLAGPTRTAVRTWIHVAFLWKRVYQVEKKPTIVWNIYVQYT